MNLTQIILRKAPTPRNGIFGLGPVVSKIAICQKSTKEPPSSSSSSSSSSSTDSDEEAKKKTTPNEAVTRLNTLLQQLISDEASRAQNEIHLAQPRNKRTEGRKEKETVTHESVEKQMVNAVKDVAESLGGNTKQTESELLMKLLNPADTRGLSDILKGMKIEREEKPPQSRAEQVRSVLEQVSVRGPRRPADADAARPQNRRRPSAPAVRLE